MTPDRARLADLLLAAFEKPAADRRAFLESACAGDADLLAEALDYLAAEDDLGDFLERPAGAGPHEPDSPTITVAPEPGRGQKLGRRWLGAHEIVGEVGAGGMGEVYVGEDSRLGRRVAVKILPRAVAERPGWLRRFEREARVLASLNHPNIVTIHSVEEDDGIRFLTMELVDGKTLKEAIPGGGMARGEFFHVAAGLVGALAAAHDNDVIHRDLKPANVMITADGRVKVLDFGLAKDTTRRDHALSMDGVVVGTVPYMAPEQIRGEAADARSDVFAVGIVLYQMATGRHPFPADGPVRTAQAILEDEPVPAREVRPELGEELNRIISRCLGKDPERRFQNAGELRRQLKRLAEARLAEKILESRPFRRRRETLVAAVALVLALVALAWALYRVPAPGPPVGPKTALAVLFFQNLTGDAELDWLATGIPELLVTDLSQSPGLDVLKTDELYRIQQEIDASEEIAASPRAVRELAAEAEVEAVVRGSYARLGDLLRIAYTIEDPASGEVRRSGSLEGRGEESLFGLVDSLSAVVLASFGAPRPEFAPAKVEEVTTASVEAWQAYTEGQTFFYESPRLEKAIAKMEQALAIDPDFALAAVSAGKMHQSLGHTVEAEEYARRAFENAERLPLKMRYHTEASYYGSRWSTISLAIEKYDLALKIYADVRPWRNNLARRYAYFERYPEAIETIQPLVESEPFYWFNYYNAASFHAALGDFETGHGLLTHAVEEEPGDWRRHQVLAWHLTDWGRLEEAGQAFDRMVALSPDPVQLHYGRWRWEVLREAWPAATSEARRLLEIDDAFARWRGRMALAQIALYQGRSEEALSWLHDAVGAATGADRALVRCFLAELLLLRGDATGALEQAQEAQEEGREQWPELRGYALAARAEEHLGRRPAADALVEILRERWRRQQNNVEQRQNLHLAGLLALARGDDEEGLAALERAAELLPPRGIEFHWHALPVHLPIWADLGEAALGADRPRAALAWLERATASHSERPEQPVAYVRSWYLKGLAHHRLGEVDEARRSWERFLGFWAEGDLHRDWVADVRSHL